ncbi:MAG: hypothetical protein M3Y54_08760 [Bacteroidota bacterium]|nr:hypothetical protein [Bacteroidota bacterium]
MLRLDKTVTRKVPLHYDQDADDRTRWQAMSFAEKREVVWHLQQRTKGLHALCEQGREQDQNKNATLSSGESAN